MVNVDVELDAKGMYCPMPIVKLKKSNKNDGNRTSTKTNRNRPRRKTRRTSLGKQDRSRDTRI